MESASSKWLLGVGLVILALVIASVVVSLLNRSQSVTLLPAGTPGETVQGFLLAIEDGENRKAYDYLSTALQEECTLEHFRDSTRAFNRRDRSGENNPDTRISLESERPIDDAIEVRVRITEIRVSAPFDVNEHSHTQDFLLESLDGHWQFVDEPWPMTWCPEPERTR